MSDLCVGQNNRNDRDVVPYGYNAKIQIPMPKLAISQVALSKAKDFGVSSVERLALQLTAIYYRSNT